MAAPIASQVLGEVLDYLEIEPDSQTEEVETEEVTVPNVVGMTVLDAKKELQKVGLELELDTEVQTDESTTIIKAQLPKYGITVYEGTSIYVTI